MPAVWPASLVPRESHNPDLLRLLCQDVSPLMMSYIAEEITRVIRIEQSPQEKVNNPALLTPPTTPTKTDFAHMDTSSSSSPQSPPLISLESFIVYLVRRSNVQAPTLLTTLIYLHRLKKKLPPTAIGETSTRHRVFLALLIISAKYLNDSPPLNKHWAYYAKLFEIRDIKFMECQVLLLLGYDLRLSESEAYNTFAPLMSATAQLTRLEAVEKVSKAGKARALAQALLVTPPSDRDTKVFKPSSRNVHHQHPTQHHHHSQTTASTLVSAVRGIAKRLSSTHLRRASSFLPISSPSSSVFSNFGTVTTTNATACSAVSAFDSLTDDSGSYYSSSSSESSTHSESDDPSPSQRVQERLVDCDNSRCLGKPNSAVAALQTHCYPPHTWSVRERCRKPSGGSVNSVGTVRCLPCLSTSPERKRSVAGRQVSAACSFFDNKDDGGDVDDAEVDTGTDTDTSTDVPANAGRSTASTPSAFSSLTSSSASGFLSRVWGAAKGHSNDLTPPSASESTTATARGTRHIAAAAPMSGASTENDGQPAPRSGRDSAFRRLIMMHSRSSLFPKAEGSERAAMVEA